MSLVTLSLAISTVETKRRSEGGKLIRGSKTYDDICLFPAEMDTWMSFQGARTALALLGKDRFKMVPSGRQGFDPQLTLIDAIDEDWVKLCGRTEAEIYQCCQADGQFVLVPRNKRVAYSAPFDQWTHACYGRPHRFAKATKVTDLTRHMWERLTMPFEGGFSCNTDASWFPIYPEHVYKTRAPSAWKCSLCGKEHFNPHYDTNWMNRRYIDYCPHCHTTYTPRFMSIGDLVEPTLSFIEVKQDPYVFWIGGERITRRAKPVIDKPSEPTYTPF